MHQVYTVYHCTDMAGRMLGHCVGYVPVARVFASAPEDVYRFTNHGNGTEWEDWDDNPTVECLVDNPRSTSVGDYFVREDGMRFDVQSRGFSRLQLPARYGNISRTEVPSREVVFR